MCPMCWATALASFGGIFAVSVLLVAGTDWWTLLLAGFLGAFLPRIAGATRNYRGG